MPTTPNFLQRLWNAFAGKEGKNEPGSIQGSQIAPIFGSSRQVKLNLEVPEIPIRPINNDLGLARELIEMKTWSYEARHSISLLARDCFQRQDGSFASWFLPATYGEDEAVNPDIIAIAKDLQNRYNGKTLVLGGNRLERAVRDILWSGDAFLELAIEREGIGKNDYGISKSLYLPSLSMFVDESEQGDSRGFWQRTRFEPGTDDRYIPPVKMLHFMHEEQTLYGQSVLLPSVEFWRKLKEVAIDLEEASRSMGVSPWLHIMAPERDDVYKAAYAQDIENRRRSGIITDLFLLQGADVRKAAIDSTVLQPLLDHYMALRVSCIPPGVPNWVFPFLALKDSGQKDLSSQPALAYGRYISYLRSVLGEQVRWALAVEIVLKKGFDFYNEHKHEVNIEWEPFIVDPNSATMATKQVMDEQDEGDGEESIEDDEDMQRLVLDARMLLNTPDLDQTDAMAIDSLQRRVLAGLSKHPDSSKLRKIESQLKQVSRELTHA